jgi:hypothetical protein
MPVSASPYKPSTGAFISAASWIGLFGQSGLGGSTGAP